MLRDWTDSLRFDGMPAEVERLFVRLIMKADDYGRFYADPRLLKIHCLPLIENLRLPDVSRWLDELSTRGLILRYEADGRTYLAIVNFGQRLKESRPKFPPRPGEPREWLPVSDDFREVPGSSGNLPLEEKGREYEADGGSGSPPAAGGTAPPAGVPRRISKPEKSSLAASVMSLRPAWEAMGPLSPLEEKHFEAHLHILAGWPDDLWQLLRDYLAAKVRPESSLWQPKGRIKFLEAPGELVPHAMEWSVNRPKPKAPRPDAPEDTGTTIEDTQEALRILRKGDTAA